MMMVMGVVVILMMGVVGSMGVVTMGVVLISSIERKGVEQSLTTSLLRLVNPLPKSGAIALLLGIPYSHNCQ